MNEMQLLTTTMIMKYCNVLDIVLDTKVKSAAYTTCTTTTLLQN